MNEIENPAEGISCDPYPSERLANSLVEWEIGFNSILPNPSSLTSNDTLQERDEVCHHTAFVSTQPDITWDRFSNFTRLKRGTAWLIRFVNCHIPKTKLHS